MKKLVKLSLIGAGVCLIVMAAKCSWLHRIVGEGDSSSCVCVECVDTCEHAGEVCDCDDNNCGCPACTL